MTHCKRPEEVEPYAKKVIVDLFTTMPRCTQKMYIGFPDEINCGSFPMGVFFFALLPIVSVEPLTPEEVEEYVMFFECIPGITVAGDRRSTEGVGFLFNIFDFEFSML